MLFETKGSSNSIIHMLLELLLLRKGVFNQGVYVIRLRKNPPYEIAYYEEVDSRGKSLLISEFSLMLAVLAKAKSVTPSFSSSLFRSCICSLLSCANWFSSISSHILSDT